MHIHYLSLNFIPGRGTHTINIMNTCQAFADQPDTRVTLLIGHNSEIQRQFGMDFWKFYGIKENFEIVFSPIYLTWLKKWKWMRKMMAVFHLYKYIARIFKRNNEDFIFYSRHLNIASLVTFVSRLHGNQHFGGFFCELHSLNSRKRSLNACRGIVVISHALKKDFLEKKLLHNPEKILVAHDGVNLKRFQGTGNKDKEFLRKELHIATGKKVIAYTGRVIFGKGVDILIQAFSKLPNQENLLLVLIGKIYSSEFRKLAEDLKLVNILFIDFIPPVQVHKFQLCADILVMPTTKELSYAQYTSPIKLFEYMASRVPIVASSLPSIEEIIKDKESGLLFEPGNNQSLSDTLNFAVEHETEVRRMAEQAAIDVIKYDWSMRGKNILRFILPKTN